MKRISAAFLLALTILLMIFSVTSWAEDDREGYWECIEVRHETKHFNEELVDKDYWSYSMSGSAGTGTFTSTYIGPGQEDDYMTRAKNGENGMVTGSVSKPPKYINGGQTVKLKINLSVSTSKQHAIDWDGDADAWFDETDIPIGYITGSALRFTEKGFDGEDIDLSAWIYAPTNWRAKEYGNRPKLNTEVSAQAPYGSKEDDKISIYTQVGMGNMASRTEYVYRWHAEGKAPLENTSPDGKGSDEQKRSEEEKRILEAWRKNQQNTITKPEVTPDPQYKDSGIRFSDLWGQVAIRRKGGYDDDWEYARLDTIIYYGDEIWTEADSGCVLILRSMNTFVVKEKTVMHIPEEEKYPSAIEILSGNVWTNLKKMWEGGEFRIEMQQVVAGARGTTFAAEQTDESSAFYLFTSSADVTSKITGEKVTLKPGEYAEVDSDGIITVKTFDIPSKAKELSLPMEILKDDGYKEGGNLNMAGSLRIILPVAGIIAVIVAAAIIISKKKKAAQQIIKHTLTPGEAVPKEYRFESPMPSSGTTKPLVEPATAEGTDTWICSCGKVNKGNFCISCGKAKGATVPPGKKLFCGNCGSERKQDAKFCAKCGQRL
ncbi:MAG TPA: hypothetical protein GXX36_02515 [Clostridiaceae bacterium]|nr:hypothetical protein [Clostridiaceae bacterium]